MESTLDILRRHPNFNPAKGIYDDEPTNEEIWASNMAGFFELVEEGVLFDTVENGVVRVSKEEKWQHICETYGRRGNLTPQDEMRMVEVNYQRMVSRMAEAGVPNLYFEVLVDERHNEAFSHGRGAYIYGEPGVGKTAAACSMLKGWMKSNPSCKPIFVTSPQMISEMRSTYGTGQTQEDVMLRYTKCPMLIIDDFGKEALNEDCSSRMWRVINDRSANWKPTIITTEYPPDALVSRFDANIARSIGSRIRGYYDLFNLKGRDRRLS